MKILNIVNCIESRVISVSVHKTLRGGLVVNASDYGSRGRGFEPHCGQTVLCPSARPIYSSKALVIPRKRWLRPHMTEKLFTGTVRINNQPKPCIASSMTLAVGGT